MTKRVANKLTKRNPKRNVKIVEASASRISSSDLKNVSGKENYSQLIREVINNPEVKYVAGGIAASILERLATGMSKKYPELSKFLKENLDSFEERLAQYRPEMSSFKESRV
jgi:hypothetical protein